MRKHCLTGARPLPQNNWRARQDSNLLPQD
jgi:hypothetical protein